MNSCFQFDVNLVLFARKCNFLQVLSHTTHEPIHTDSPTEKMIRK